MNYKFNEKLSNYMKETKNDHPYAKNAILKGIDRFEREHKRNYWIYFRRFVLSSACIIVVFVVGIKVNPSFASLLAKVPVLGTISHVLTQDEYTSEVGNMSANVRSAMLMDESNAPALDSINDELQEYSAHIIEQYEKDLIQNQGLHNYKLNSDYVVLSDTNKYLCIEVMTTVEMAGTQIYTKDFTIDKDSGSVVKINELFTSEQLNLIAENIVEQMKEQMQVDSTVSYWLSDDPQNDDLAFTSFTGDEDFYFDEFNNLVVVFDKYEVAPGNMGVVRFTIDSSVYN